MSGRFCTVRDSHSQSQPRVSARPEAGVDSSPYLSPHIHIHIPVLKITRDRITSTPAHTTPRRSRCRIWYRHLTRYKVTTLRLPCIYASSKIPSHLIFSRTTDHGSRIRSRPQSTPRRVVRRVMESAYPSYTGSLDGPGGQNSGILPNISIKVSSSSSNGPSPSSSDCDRLVLLYFVTIAYGVYTVSKWQKKTF
ncbi:hypothetical protein BJY04DRAFT_77691 [Aspergillus karnatakaensis]|uniref:uncharacterized protein n=1 Tax=Aspergillus karnatakaensis TaxID=1810916 RepID=UPI003CCDB9A7